MRLKACERNKSMGRKKIEQKDQVEILYVVKGFTLLIILILFFISLLFLLALYVLDTDPSEDQIKRVTLLTKNGNVIVRTFYQFRDQHGKFPKDLDELVPQYIDKKKQETISRSWIYSSNDNSLIFRYRFISKGSLKFVDKPHWETSRGIWIYQYNRDEHMRIKYDKSIESHFENE